jgi:hypothetical protein
MSRAIHCPTGFQTLSATALSLLLSGTVAAQSVPSSVPGPTRSLAAPPSQSQPSTARQSANSQVSNAQVPIQASYPGTIEGFVYWDASTFSHNPPARCSGLAVTVSTGSQPGGSQLGTLSDNFKYVGQVANFGVCTYAFNHVPVGQNLQVQISVTAESVFSPSAASPAPITPVNIINGKCNNLWSMVPSSTSELTTHWWTCGNYAYNVNFVLQGSSQVLIPNAGGGMLLQRSTAATRQSTPSSGQGTPGALLPANSGNSTLLSGNAAHTAGSVTALNTQPTALHSLPSNKGGQGALRTKGLVPVKLGPPKQGPKITNPKASANALAITASLQKQRTAADAESVRMQLTRPSAGTQIGTLHTTAATGTGGSGAVAAPFASPVASGAKPSTTNSHSDWSEAVASPLQNIAITCGYDPTMRVLTVSGGPGPAVFTQDAKYNFYTIVGCSFGEVGTNSKVYIYYQGTFREDFQIQEWSDNWIKLSLDPNLKGVDDQDNLMLIIQREDGKQATKGGFRFYAARDTILLSAVSKQYFSLDHFRPDNALTNGWIPTYTSASSASVPPNMPGLTAEVHWDLETDSATTPVGGDDLYDFSKLHPTFQLDSASMQWADLSCTDPNNNQFASSKNNWDIAWNGNAGIKVTWQAQACNPTPGSCGGGWPFSTDCFVGPPTSDYGVDVWVTGPRGLDPWTGQIAP